MCVFIALKGHSFYNLHQNAGTYQALIFILSVKKQETHMPQLAHLSEIATADMQMLCNIFPILSLQLEKAPLPRPHPAPELSFL